MSYNNSKKDKVAAVDQNVTLRADLEEQQNAYEELSEGTEI
jgi:hypothetical protein